MYNPSRTISCDNDVTGFHIIYKCICLITVNTPADSDTIILKAILFYFRSYCYFPNICIIRYIKFIGFNCRFSSTFTEFFKYSWINFISYVSTGICLLSRNNWLYSFDKFFITIRLMERGKNNPVISL